MQNKDEPQFFGTCDHLVTTAALIVAAGRGSRASRPGLPPKQYARIGGVPVLAHGVRTFLAHPGIDFVAVVIHSDDDAHYQRAVLGFGDGLLPPVIGGTTRQQSVRLGLEAIEAKAPDLVLIHDAARPFVDAETIGRVIDALDAHAGAIVAEPVADTLKREREGGLVAGTVDRAGLWRAQTPQAFRFEPLLVAHRRAYFEGFESFTDDAALAEWAGLDVKLVGGSAHNVKLTTAEDIAMAERLLGSAPAILVPPVLVPHVGSGFDVHRFTVGDHVWLCGVRIDHDAGLEGHSDADAALHALTDAILGALGDGDIGQHFPPSDPAWKGAPSRVFVEDAARRVVLRGGRIVNVDITILCERPRIGVHRSAMQQAIATLLSIDASNVGIKATTTEQLGFTGRGEGLAAMASAMVLLPD